MRQPFSEFCIMLSCHKRQLSLMIVALLQPAGHFWPPSCEECINNPEKKGSPGQDARAAAAASYLVCAPFLGRNTLTLVLEVRST